MSEINNKKTCRICLQTSKTLYSLFKKINGKSPHENLITRTNLNIQLEDSGPSSICAKCLHDLDVTVRFLERCEESNKALTNMCIQKLENAPHEFNMKVKEEKPNNEDKEVRKESVVKSRGKCTECEGRIRCKHLRKPLHTCQYCQKVFSDRSNFNRHIKRHAGTRDWPCPACGALLLTSWLAWRHCRPPPRAPCPHCRRSFANSTALNVHLRRHTGERPFECNNCDKKFISKSVLNNHMRTHSGEKPYVCSICGKQFTTNKLHAHMLAAHGVRRTAPRGRPRELFLHPQTMPRNYKRKTNRGEWSEDSMIKALDAVKNGMPYRTASKQYSVPLMTLKRRAKGTNKVAVGAIKYLGGKKTVFTVEQEIELVKHIKDMETRMYGLTRQDALSLAYQLAVKNNISHPFQREKAGYDWLRGFRQRHPDIALRAPESTSTARARAFNKPVVDKFFSVLTSIQQNKNHPPHRIFNVDETGLSTVPTKNTKVFAATGRKQVARVTSAERGETTTAVICMSASGSFVPPMFVFKRIRMKIELMDGAPPGSTWACNSSGWMNLDVFTKWFDHFLAYTKPSADDPVLLILDGHLSHTKNLDLILKARENHVTIVCLPPHCTHKLQPLDVSLMYPLSVYHNQSLEKWMNKNPGRPVTVFQIAKIFGEAYIKAAVMSNAINGFSKTGIYPLNPDVFSESDYLAAATTDIEPTMDLSPPQTVISQDTLQELQNKTPPPTPVILQDLQNKTPPPTPINYDGDFSVRNPLSPIPSTSYVRNTSVSPSILEDTQPEPFYISPAQIHPLPKIVGKRSHLKRKRMDTSILTSTPYKNYLEEERNKKTEKENRKTQKELNAKKNHPKKKQKGKGIGKGMSNRKKQKIVSDSSEEEEDAECLFCTETFAKDDRGEGWVKCGVCQRWGHEACAGIDSDDDEFTCDWCTTAPEKRRLDL